MLNTTLKRREKVREILAKQGVTMKEWCIKNGVSRNLVNAVITGKNPGRFNKGHKVAVLLGIKKGEGINH